jgi:hypothetical protein
MMDCFTTTLMNSKQVMIHKIRVNSIRTEVLEENTENAFIPRKLDGSNN